MSSRVLKLVAASVLVGCSPYDPDLPSQPFLCSDTDPTCPEGYSCVARPGRDPVCQTDVRVPDGGGGQCSVDTSEPNETIEAPTIVPIPELGEMHEVAAVLCPETDLDIYKVNVDTTGKNIRVQVGYDPAGGMLDVSLLNSVGVSIRTATPKTGDATTLRADFENVATGVYYARVRSVEGMGVRAGYDISFLVTSGALPN